MSESRVDPQMKSFEALASIELESIHPGLPVLDAMLKQAPVDILTATPIPPGRFLIVVTGGVGEIESSYRRGLEVSGPPLDHLFLPDAHPEIFLAIARTRARDETHLALGEAAPPASGDALALYETGSISAGLHAADRILKETDVELASLHLGRGICGKSFGVVVGRQDMVEAAVEVAEGAAALHAGWIGSSILPRPDDALFGRILSSPWGLLGGQEIL